MNIKVCGITQMKKLQHIDGLDIDFAGLNFQKASPRYAGDKLRGKDVKQADFDLKKTGVFVNEDYEYIMQIVDDYGLDMVQLDGHEPPSLCDDLSDEVEVIKTFRIGPAAGGLDAFMGEYDEVCDYYLFSPVISDGLKDETGLQFDWKLLSKVAVEKPFFLSGGIGLADAALVKAFRHPDGYAVDISNRFEKEPGIIDMSLVLQFRQALK